MKSKVVPAAALSCACPAVLLPRNWMVPAFRLMIALPADEVSSNRSGELLTLKVGAFDGVVDDAVGMKHDAEAAGEIECVGRRAGAEDEAVDIA